MVEILLSIWLAVSPGMQPSPAQDAWLKGFEGTWVLDTPRPTDAKPVVVITREGGNLVLRVTLGAIDVVTRYDLGGADIANTSSVAGTSIFRSKIEGQRIKTQIWADKVSGQPQTYETRYLESPDVMITELSRSPDGPAFRKDVLRRKPKSP